MNRSGFDEIEAKCPFYKKSDAVCIYCEGIMPQSNIRISFANKGEKVKYFRNHCAHIKLDFDCDCLIAQMLNKKYNTKL